MSEEKQTNDLQSQENQHADSEGGIIPEVRAKGVGETLRAAREARGWSTADAGTRLRLMARQIDAMESENFASLGQPVFARGFVRNYAKLLDLDFEPLLQSMSLSVVPPKLETENIPFVPAQGFWTSPWVMSSIGAIILILAVPVALYLWLNSGEKERQPEVQKIEVPLAGAAPVAPAVIPVPQQPPPPATEQAQAVPGNAAVVPEPAANPAAAVPVAPKPPAVPPVQHVPQAQPKPAVPSAAEPLIKPHSSIKFRFEEQAWVEVKDGYGRMIHSALGQAGSTLELSGTPPFALVVGNAARVQVMYNNKPVDIKPYIDVKVARFNLN